VTSSLTTILLIAAIALCVVGTWAALRLAAAAKSVKTLADDMEARLVPLTDKADVTVDALNAELLRLDMIVTQIEDASDRVAAASSAIHTVVNAPLEAVNELSDRVRRSMAARKAKQE
jgi:hypothetical protein